MTDTSPSGPISLNVRTLEGQTHSIDIPLSQTVLQLKDHLATLLSVPSPRQRLIFRGRVMADDKPLTEYSLEDGHTLHLVTRPADAPTNSHNDAPQARQTARRPGSATGSGPLRFDTRDYQLSIIGVDDGPLDQQIMQALGGLGGAHGLDMDLDGGSTLIQIAGEPSLLRSLLGANGGHFVQLGGAGPGTAEAFEQARALRSRMVSHGHVPLGASLPPLETIEAELTRVATQLRNVQTILSHPVDQLEGIELEPLDVPPLEAVNRNVDGDSTDIVRMGGILTQLSETSRAMANQLQSLSDQYNNTLGSSDHANLQRVSHRAARAMYRLASVQNTVFPMLANAAFVGTAPGSVSYRYQPQPPAATNVVATPQPVAGERSPSQQGRTIQGIPFPAFIRGAGASPVTMGMIPSIMAHARASAQSVNAAMAAAAAAAGAPGVNSTTPASTAPATATPATTSTTPAAPTTPATPAVPRTATAQRTVPAASVPVPQPGAGPIGQMVLGPNGSLSYTIQAPMRLATRSSGRLPTYAAAAAAAANPFALNSNQGMPTRFMIPADFAGAGFLDFWRNLSGQATTPASTTPSASASASGSASTRAGAASGPTQAEVSSNASSSSRRRERPEDLSQEGTDRAASRRRLATQVSQMNSSLLELEDRLQHELGHILERSGLGLGLELGLGSGPGSGSAALSIPAQSSRSNTSNSNNTNANISSTSLPLARTQPSTRPTTTRSSSNDARRTSGATESSSPVSSPSPSSPSVPSLSSQTSSSSASSSAASSAYNLGRIGVFISAILRMVDQPREDGSPRTLADVICNDPESSSTPLHDLVRNIAESITVRETRSIVEGHPAPIRNIHPTLNSFIRERALSGQQLTESNLELVAVMFAHGIMNAVHVEDILETLSPPVSIQISSADIRRISLDVLREHFRRLIYLVVAAPAGRESPTFARDVILWIRDVVGAWRVSFYGLFSERDQPEAQRIATHVVGSAIHDNGRRWVELSNRATNTLVNVLCANIVPRRRGEEQAGGLVGGAWPLMATGPRQNNAPRSSVCRAPSLLGSTAHPVPMGPIVPSVSSNDRGSASGSFSRSLLSNSTTAAQITPSQVSSAEVETLSSNLARRIGEMMSPLGVNTTALESLYGSSIREAIRAELANMRASTTSTSTTVPSTSSSSSAPASTTVPSSSNSSETTTAKTEKPDAPDLRTRIEDAEDEDMV
ncbi:hypothetical protein KI688_011641 [Linnemannia hyalina]|uniref:Ubiquitin-like domain-containing protein n=1 Tax=Linnemannia hyalina TaxID=64524 RepID=A0A9P8BTB0_9FUNG|nr:hypothetical protein KI688_011641 [Linnemannia hyalina]